jgi:hypothetical protein
MDLENSSHENGTNSPYNIDNSVSGLMPMSITTPDSTSLPLDSSTDKSSVNKPRFLQCPMEDVSFGRALYDRCSWLIGLLLFQSCSSYILADNVELLQSHPAIIFYLTMLVGAGGNAGWLQLIWANKCIYITLHG